MKKRVIMARSLTTILTTSMAAGLCPTNVFAVTGSQVAADGTYTASARVERNDVAVENEDDWLGYNVDVSITVNDGIISEIKVSPGAEYDSENDSYFNKAVNKSKGIQTLLVGQPATEETIKGWDVVSGATCTSEAVKEAALEAIQSAPEASASVEVDTEELEAAITAAEALNESDYTVESWEYMQEKLAEAKIALEEKESQEKINAAKDELNQAVEDLVKAEPEGPAVAEETYVLMNIPYAEFYRADVNNSIPVDAFTSATLNKTRTASLAGGSYHVDPEGSDITGITFPVKVAEGVDLSSYTQITDDSSVDITVTNRGTTTTTTYSGKEALFESASYSYYILSEAPSYYKEVSANEDGSLSFGKTIGEVTTLSGIIPEFSTESGYGDYQLSMSGLENTIDASTDQVYGVIVSTKEGNDYGMRHLENIWRVTELAWCTGFTDAVHNCPTSSVHYERMMGQTINRVIYYTSKGIYEIPVSDIYVPVKFEYSLSVDDASVSAGSTTVHLSGLPDDYEAEYSVEGLVMSVADGVMTFSDAAKGKYTLVIHDGSGKYADITTDFILYTEEMPAVYNEDGDAPALVKSEDASEEEFTDYLQNITSVTVNEKSYPATGRGAVVIVNEDGTINTEAEPFAEGDSFEITVSSTGYKDLSFVYDKNPEEPEEPEEPENPEEPEVPVTPVKPARPSWSNIIVAVREYIRNIFEQFIKFPR